GIGIGEGKHGSAEGPNARCRKIALRKLRVGIMVEHFQDSGEVCTVVEEKVKSVKGTGVGSSRNFDAAIRTGETCALQEVANRKAVGLVGTEKDVLLTLPAGWIIKR